MSDFKITFNFIIFSIEIDLQKYRRNLNHFANCTVTMVFTMKYQNGKRSIGTPGSKNLTSFTVFGRQNLIFLFFWFCIFRKYSTSLRVLRGSCTAFGIVIPNEKNCQIFDFTNLLHYLNVCRSQRKKEIKLLSNTKKLEQKLRRKKKKHEKIYFCKLSLQAIKMWREESRAKKKS